MILAKSELRVVTKARFLIVCVFCGFVVLGFCGSIELGKNCIKDEEESADDFDPQFKRLAVSRGAKTRLLFADRSGL